MRRTPGGRQCTHVLVDATPARLGVDRPPSRSVRVAEEARVLLVAAPEVRTTGALLPGCGGGSDLPERAAFSVIGMEMAEPALQRVS